MSILVSHGLTLPRLLLIGDGFPKAERSGYLCCVSDNHCNITGLHVSNLRDSQD